MRYLLLLLALACTPAREPKPLDIATAAVVVTDQALAVAITADPNAGSDPKWQYLVDRVKNAAEVVKAAGQFCDIADDLTVVSNLVRCKDCASVITAAKEAAKCQP